MNRREALAAIAVVPVVAHGGPRLTDDERQLVELCAKKYTWDEIEAGRYPTAHDRPRVSEMLASLEKRGFIEWHSKWECNRVCEQYDIDGYYVATEKGRREVAS